MLLERASGVVVKTTDYMQSTVTEFGSRGSQFGGGRGFIVNYTVL